MGQSKASTTSTSSSAQRRTSYSALATLTDKTLTDLVDTFGATTTRKYVATIVWFSLLSLFLNGLRVPLETTDKIGDRTSPLPRSRVA